MGFMMEIEPNYSDTGVPFTVLVNQFAPADSHDEIETAVETLVSEKRLYEQQDDCYFIDDDNAGREVYEN
jgi:hypothetical protein